METLAQSNGASAPDFLSVREAARVLRIGKTCAYELAQEFIYSDGASGLKVLRVGRQLRVPRTALEEMLGGPISWPPGNSPKVVGKRRAADKSSLEAPSEARDVAEQPQRLFSL